MAAAASTQITFSKSLHSADSQSALPQLVCSHGQENSLNCHGKDVECRAEALKKLIAKIQGRSLNYFVI